MHHFTSIAPLVERYDAFIIDLWGVIHDGQKLYPNVLPALEFLQQKNKRIIFLSNAPRRSKKAALVLDKLGINKNLYSHIITSGETVFQQLDSRTLSLGQSFYILGPDKDDDILDGVHFYKRTLDITSSDFILATGFDEDHSVLEDVKDILDTGLSLNIPLICANPDIEVVRQDGTRALCAGVMAAYYQEQGGNVISFGKPHADVYHACFKHFGSIPKQNIAAIGDNLDTDIKGANEQSIDSYLIAGGILAEIFHISHGQLPDPSQYDRYIAQKGITPTAVLPAFLL